MCVGGMKNQRIKEYYSTIYFGNKVNYLQQPNQNNVHLNVTRKRRREEERQATLSLTNNNVQK